MKLSLRLFKKSLVDKRKEKLNGWGEGDRLNHFPSSLERNRLVAKEISDLVVSVWTYAKAFGRVDPVILGSGNQMFMLKLDLIVNKNDCYTDTSQRWVFVLYIEMLS